MLTEWPNLQRMVDQACRRFNLRVSRLIPMTDMRVHDYGYSWETNDETHECAVQLRVHVIGRPKVGLKWSTVVKTLAHELAHVACFKLYGSTHRHSRHFYKVMREVLDYWRSQGWEGF